MTALSCGGRTTGTPASPTPPGLTGTRVVTGVVLRTQEGAPVAGATVKLTQGGAASTVTDASGRFTLSQLPEGPLLLALTAPGYIDYHSRLQVTNAQGDTALEIIPDGGPFNLEFYRQFVRDATRTQGLAFESTHRWTMAPSFYFRTVTEENERPVPDGIIDGVERIFTNAVPELSGERYQVAAFETGAAPGEPRDGWVNVSFREQGTSSTIGAASVGGNSGTMWIIYDPARGPESNYFHCDSLTLYVADHEIVHTMGFYHTAPPWGTQITDFQSGEGCPGSGRPERTRYHAAVMYSRPRGNQDPDTDPGLTYVLDLRARSGPVISCVVPGVGGR
jgi:Carboxypeptidase regulatory-like domain